MQCQGERSRTLSVSTIFLTTKSTNVIALLPLTIVSAQCDKRNVRVSAVEPSYLVEYCLKPLHECQGERSRTLLVSTMFHTTKNTNVSVSAVEPSQ